MDVRKIGTVYELVDGQIRFRIQHGWHVDLFVPDRRLSTYRDAPRTFINVSKSGFWFWSSKEWYVSSTNPEYALNLAKCLSRSVDPKNMETGDELEIEVDNEFIWPGLCRSFEWDPRERQWTAELWELCDAIAECLLTTPIPNSDLDDVSSGELSSY
jgi:hypothetical protein